MAKQTVTKTTKTTKINIGTKKKSTGSKRCPTCGKYMGSGGK